ncbi:MAG: fumarylacetoacetate hydrolase family protein [Phenylobacterium sp.]|uniref:fumarylacetoacetate hydrolase family protein n=1 Tax=Phenylobacterium sp. TaxID=1871053 RepID=UPI0027158039|nr:fumarylacetoacetate hydrolase family protein [Phenylobacterium sp.]MDO8913141.1 fumarylacetoacetate hydrolase family protein [Phenylobacterium sp.]MDP3102481.1 fumarylacetoacetate hydrolase family protein [Phenylobacterium sp.]
MKIAFYDDGSGPRTGIVTAERLTPTGLAGGMAQLIAAWDDVQAELRRREAAGDGAPLASVRLLPPVPRPGKVFAIGLNYADHIAESKMETPQHQVWFTKAVTSVNGPFDPVQISRISQTVDYEAELVAVIGKGGKHIGRDEAAARIFGYCVGNDVTERMWQHRTAQWSLGKSFDTHAPIGPWITTSDEIDPHNLALKCLVNGEERQSSNTRHLVFDVFDQVAHLSQAMTLEPGDLVFTGTPGGIGAAMTPRRFLKPGDVVRCEIEGLGHIENRFEPEA